MIEGSGDIMIVKDQPKNESMKAVAPQPELERLDYGYISVPPGYVMLVVSVVLKDHEQAEIKIRRKMNEPDICTMDSPPGFALIINEGLSFRTEPPGNAFARIPIRVCPAAES